MKGITTTTNVFAIFLLFAFISFPPPSLATKTFFLDTDGDLVRNGGAYYILPVIRGSGGGIGRIATGNETCPLTVVQQRSVVDNGLPLIISTPVEIPYLIEGLPIDIFFTYNPECTPSPDSHWTLIKGLPDGEGRAVRLWGFYENQISGWFRVSKHFDDYKFIFCQEWHTCSDIGIQFDDQGNRLLVATDDKPPFMFVFKKANKSSYSA